MNMSESICLSSADCDTLQKTSAHVFIGSIVDSFLGPNKSLKFIIDDTETVLTCCPLLLFRTVSSLRPLEHLVEEVLCSHHEQYGCTSITLLAMWYYWEQELQLLMEEGMEPSIIFNYVQICIEEVIKLLPTIEISTEKVLDFLEKKTPTSAAINTRRIFLPSKNNELLKKPLISISRNQIISSNQGMSYGVMISSRHFSPASRTAEEEVSLMCSSIPNCAKMQKVDYITENDRVALHDVVKKLCREDFALSDLIAKAWELQMMHSRSPQFNLNSIIVCPIVGPASNSSVIDGLLVETNGKESFVSQHRAVCTYKALLINADATPNYKHLGFAPEIIIEMSKTVEDMSLSAAETWLRNCLDVILKLEVSLLLVRGTVDSSLMEACISKSVDVISQIPFQSFKIIAEALNAHPSSYIIGCDEKNIATGIDVNLWKPDMNACVLQDKEFYIISTNSETPKHYPQTVVLCHPCKAVLNLHEHQFWHAASRLAWACQSKTVLPGCGMTEKWCYKAISKLASSRQGEDSKIFHAVASGFLKYHKAVSEKLLICEKGIDSALDEKGSKVQAWHSAVSLLTTILVDSCVINSCEESYQQYHTVIENTVQYL